jgi:hypothetical protein
MSLLLVSFLHATTLKQVILLSTIQKSLAKYGMPVINFALVLGISIYSYTLIMMNLGA